MSELLTLKGTNGVSGNPYRKRTASPARRPLSARPFSEPHPHRLGPRPSRRSTSNSSSSSSRCP
ncbi:MAG: hypothetical protein ACLR4Z_02615 [Butyricicoccaceae bacterium]